mmetsp:Transcript_5256/g.13023  ORF Transcript_5256/g.13023 Transcript_5256/m.13023 type:complete len:81 (-) Transcript_5256:99-341(-)
MNEGGMLSKQASSRLELVGHGSTVSISSISTSITGDFLRSNSKNIIYSCIIFRLAVAISARSTGKATTETRTTKHNSKTC